MARDHWATLRALLNMTEARGCTPHEAEVALHRATAVAARLGTTLDDFRRDARSAEPPRTRPARPASQPSWAQAAEAARQARQREYEREQAEAKRYEEEANRRWEEARRRADERARILAEHVRQQREAAERYRRTGDSMLQPAWRRLLGLLRQDTWTAAELGAILGLEPHTVRAMISRMRTVGGVKIHTTKRGRETAYNSPPA